ncbi:MAG: hypothetical protein QOD75_2084 [Blastocatellia bacterium]|nr:hypothetical protein [Blastocatellia bacterium]
MPNAEVSLYTYAGVSHKGFVSAAPAKSQRQDPYPEGGPGNVLVARRRKPDACELT